MPWAQAMVNRLNSRFNHENINDVPVAALAPGESLVEAGQKLGIIANGKEAALVNSWPASVKAAVMATLADAVSRSPRVPVQMVWKPAAGFGVEIWEAAGVGGSDTAISAVVHSPVPPS